MSPAFRPICAHSAPHLIHGRAKRCALLVYRVVREAGSLVAALGGIDAFVFSGGIGENDAATRTEIIRNYRWLGAILDPALNAIGDGYPIAASSVSRMVIPTDERLIARQTMRALCSD